MCVSWGAYVTMGTQVEGLCVCCWSAHVSRDAQVEGLHVLLECTYDYMCTGRGTCVAWGAHMSSGACLAGDAYVCGGHKLMLSISSVILHLI